MSMSKSTTNLRCIVMIVFLPVRFRVIFLFDTPCTPNRQPTPNRQFCGKYNSGIVYMYSSISIRWNPMLHAEGQVSLGTFWLYVFTCSFNMVNTFSLFLATLFSRILGFFISSRLSVFTYAPQHCSAGPFELPPTWSYMPDHINWGPKSR